MMMLFHRNDLANTANLISKRDSQITHFTTQIRPGAISGEISTLTTFQRRPTTDIFTPTRRLERGYPC